MSVDASTRGSFELDSHERERRHVAELRTLHALGTKLNRLHEVAQIANTITVELRNLIDYHACRVHLLDAERGLLIPIGLQGEGPAYTAEGVDELTIPYGVGVTGRVAQTGESLNVPDSNQCEFAVLIPGTEEVEESLLIVPMLYGRQVVGTIGLAKLGVGQFDDQAVMVLETLASHAAVAIENAKLLKLEREATAAARQSEERYRRLVELSPSAVFVHRNGRFVYVNPAGVRLLGAEGPDEIVGRPILEVVHPDYRALVQARSDAEARGEPAPLIEEKFIRLDGRVIDVEVAGIPIDYEGEPAALVAVNDISARRTAEEERRHLLSRLITAQEEERRRIAVDLHDDPIQKVTAAALRIDLAVKQVPDLARDPSVAKLGTSMREAIARMRALMVELRPYLLDEAGLAAALRAYLEQQRADLSVDCRLEDALEEQPTDERSIILYRIVQEAVTNVRKHARASRLVVRLESHEDGVMVTVRDDGVGFDPAAANGSPRGHLGLTAMRERAEMAQGWLKIVTAPGEGATVRAWVPGAPSPDDEAPPAVADALGPRLEPGAGRSPSAATV